MSAKRKSGRGATQSESKKNGLRTVFGGHSNIEPGEFPIPGEAGSIIFKKKVIWVTLRFSEMNASFFKARTFRFADYNQKQLDDINSQITVLEKQLAAQISTLENTNNSINNESSAITIQIAQLKDQLTKCHIFSPIEGTVLAKYAEPGELATTGRALFKIADIDHLFLRAYLTSDQLSSIKIGQQVTVTADFGGEQQRNYQGIVSWISSKAEFTPKGIQTRDERANLVYAVKIAVKNDGYIKIGMYGEVSFSK